MEKFKQNRYLNWESESKDALLLRLERDQRNLLQLRVQLNSYRSEPNTYTLFERLNQLRKAMDLCNRNNKEVIAALKGEKIPHSAYVAQAKKQLSTFRQLQSHVEEYLTKCSATKVPTM